MPRPFAELPEACRPRERLTSRGREALNDAELLALQLRSGTRGASAADLAADLLAEFGDLRRLAAATLEELAAIPGMGLAKAASVVAGFELGRRAVSTTPDRVRLTSASDVGKLAQEALHGVRRERVLVMVCDRRGLLIRSVELTSGAIDRALIDVRETLNAVLRHDGSSFALAHNHPSGDAQPSRSDVEVTVRLAAGAKAVGLRFLGHVVVTDDEWAEVPFTPDLRRRS